MSAPDNSHFKYGSKWYLGKIPNTQDMLDFLDPIRDSFKRLHERFVASGRATQQVAYTLPGGWVVNVSGPNSGVTPLGWGVDWISALAVDATSSTAGDTIGTPAPGSGLKRYMVIAARHEYVDSDPQVDDNGATVYQESLSQTASYVYMTAADVANADDWTTNVALATLYDAIITAGDLPLIVLERRNGASAWAAADVHTLDRLITIEGDLGAEVEALRAFDAFQATGKVMTSSGLVAATSTAIGGQPGSITLTGGEKILLAFPELGTDGKYRKLHFRQVVIPETTMALASASTKYIVRAKIDDDGALVLYNGTAVVSYPDLTQSPSPFAVGTSGGTNQAFLTTGRDIALLEVDTGVLGSAPSITQINNHSLSHVYHLLSGLFVPGANLTAADGDFTGNVTIAGTLSVDSIGGEAGSIVAFSDALDLASTLDVTGLATFDAGADITGDLTVSSDILADASIAVGFATPGDIPAGADFACQGVASAGVVEVGSGATSPVNNNAVGIFQVRGNDDTTPGTTDGIRGRILGIANGSSGGLRWEFELADDATTTKQIVGTWLPAGELQVRAQLATATIGNGITAIARRSDGAGPLADGLGVRMLAQAEPNVGSALNLGAWKWVVDNTASDGKVICEVSNAGTLTEIFGVDPDVGIRSPQAAFAWASIINGGSASIADSGDGQYGVASVNRVSAGVVDVTLSNAIPNTSRVCPQVQINVAGTFFKGFANVTSSTVVRVTTNEIAASAGPVLTSTAGDVNFFLVLFVDITP